MAQSSSDSEKNELAKLAKELSEDSERLLESAIISNLKMSPEERIEAHENARVLIEDLQSAGRVLRASESESTP